MMLQDFLNAVRCEHNRDAGSGQAGLRLLKSSKGENRMDFTLTNELLILAALLGEVQQPGAERVFPVFTVLREHAHELQALDDAVDGADGHVHHGRDIRDAKLLPVVLEAVDDVKGLQKRRHIEILIHNEGPPLSDASILAQFFLNSRH